MEYINDILNQIGGLKGLALVAAACFAVGYAIRLIPAIPNKWIPAFVLPAGPLLAPFILAPGEASPDLMNPIVGIVTQGLLVGVVVHYLHEKVVSRMEEWIKSKLPGKVPLLLATLPLLGSGCATDGFTKVVEAIHEDPASSELTIQSPWGVNIVYKRTLPASFFTPPAPPNP